MPRSILPALAALLVLGTASCEHDVPTAVGDDFFTVSPRTVELVIPWSDFAEDLRVFGGFGSPTLLGHGVLANQFEGLLDARTLARFRSFPDSAVVLVNGTNTRSALTHVGGRLIVRFDTVASTNAEPVTLVANTLVPEWHSPTATWELAVDTANDRRPWPEPGAGPAERVATGVWDPAEGDSAVIELDEETILALGDTVAVSGGVRLDVEDEGHRLQVSSMLLRVDAVPELNQDTVVTLTSNTRSLTFIYQPFPEPPPDGIRIGGVPAWRTVIGFDIPTLVEEPSEMCERVECPFTLQTRAINAASLILHSRATPPAFQPTDTIRLDVRPVLAPERLPKSPLGQSVVGGPGGRAVPAEAFGENAGQQVAIPVGEFIRDLIRGETRAGDDPPSTLALLSFFEPLSISFASFEGPGDENEPYLRLIVTVTDTVEVR